MKTLFISIIFFASLSCFAQAQKDYLLSYIDTTSGKDLIGFKDRAGKIIIKAKYWNFGYEADKPEKMYQFTCVYGDRGWVYINRKDSTILVPFIYDNGPDYIEEGLFRFIENGKMGFANNNLQKIIPAKYSFATPFIDGISAYYIGGQRIYEGGKTADQIHKEGGNLMDRHWWWGGNVTDVGYLNKYGQVFDSIGELKSNYREAITKNKQDVLLNKQGKIIDSFLPPMVVTRQVKNLFAGRWVRNEKYFTRYFEIKFETGKDYATVIDIGTGEAPPLIFKYKIVGEQLIIDEQEHYGNYCEMEIKDGELIFWVRASKDAASEKAQTTKKYMIMKKFKRVKTK